MQKLKKEEDRAFNEDPRFFGLVCLEDTLVQFDEVYIDHGYDVDRILKLGKQLFQSRLSDICEKV